MQSENDLNLYYIRNRWGNKLYFKHCPNKGYALKVSESPLKIMVIKSISFKSEQNDVGIMYKTTKAEFEQIRKKVTKELSEK